MDIWNLYVLYAVDGQYWKDADGRRDEQRLFKLKNLFIIYIKKHLYILYTILQILFYRTDRASAKLRKKKYVVENHDGNDFR